MVHMVTICPEFFFIQVELIYHVVLVSDVQDVQHSDSDLSLSLSLSLSIYIYRERYYA